MSLQKFNCRKSLTRLIVSMLFVRSLIAVGFMLSVSGSGIALIVCDGPVSFKPASAEHSGHEHHHSPDHAENSQLHISPICSDWSSSGLLAFNVFNELFKVEKYTYEEISIGYLFINESYDSINQIRAPPVLV